MMVMSLNKQYSGEVTFVIYTAISQFIHGKHSFLQKHYDNVEIIILLPMILCLPCSEEPLGGVAFVSNIVNFKSLILP